MMKLAPYPEYRETGETWFKNVPAHWKTLPLCAVARTKSITNCVDRELLSVYLDLGVIRFSDVKEKRTNATSEDLSKYQAVDPGDFVLNNQQAWRGSVGVSKYSGIVSPAYLVLEVHSELYPDYANVLFRDRKMVNQYLVSSKGVGSIQRNLYWPHLKRATVAIPPVDEQVRIAKVVKSKAAQINKFIRNKRRLIELLKEQKQNVINQAVTRGLDPNVKLKPSGVEWIGDIPEHWEVRRLKYLCHNLNEQTSEKQPSETYIALEHVESWTGRIALPDDEITFDSQVKRFQPGDVLFGKLRPYLAKVTRPQTAGVCVGEFLVLRATGDVSADFLEQKLRSKRVIDLINSSTFGAKMPRADWTFIGNLKFAYPPADEQRAIIAHINEKCAEISQAISRAEREIELMREYRTRLISDVVTGQVDVRGIEVPEVAEDELLALEEDTIDADDVIDDEGDMDETD
jgi:type I restriction enzyme S subunit